MFQFTTDGWLAVAIILFVVWFIVSVMMLTIGDYEYYGSIGLFVKHSLAVLVAFLIVANVVSIWVTTTSNETAYASAANLAEHFDVKEDQAYPLVLGDSFSGTGGDVSAQSRVGYGTTLTVNLAPESMLTIDFTYQGRTVKLDMPRTNISFIENNDAQSTVKLHFQYYAVDKSQAYYQNTYGGCQWNLTDIFLINCKRDVTSQTLVVTDEAQRKGLGPVISQFFESAEITLSSEQYQAIK